MKRMKLPRRLPTWMAVVVLALVVVPFALADATNTSTDAGQTVGGVTTMDCVHGSLVNCNEYAQKQDVFLNGSPSKSDAGTYFFAVIVPGGQPTPNDGGTKNLSDTNCLPYTCPTPTNSDGTTVPSGYSANNREFTVDSAGNINPLVGPDFTYKFDSAGNGGMGSLSVWPFDDTTNNGGVYILATCKISDQLASQPIAVPTVKASDCKYDAFKVESPTPPVPIASDLVVTKDANGSDTKTFTWGISKEADQSTVLTAGGAESGPVNYTVTVTHDGGTVSNVQVTGTIQVFNPNVDLLNNVQNVDITGVTDQLSDGTVCDVTNGGAQTLTQAETDFTYTCNLSALPQGELDNTVTVTWPTQTLPDGAVLAGNTADFTFSGITFTETLVHPSVTVSDSLEGSLGTVSFTDPSPTEFKYQMTFTDPAGMCTDHPNTATATLDDTQTAINSNTVTVTDCQGSDLTVSKTATPAFTRTFTWGVSKSADTNKVYSAGGGPSGPVNYDVSVTHDAGTDSGWQVTGTIHVANPNDWEAISADVSDAVDNGGTCTVEGDAVHTVSVPASGSVDLSYTCTYSSAPAPAAGTNTATATWDSTAASTPDGSTTGTKGFDFATASPTIVNGSVHVSDSVQGALGTVSYTDPSPTDFKYQLTFNDPAGTCTDHPNTATVSIDGTATTINSNTVTVTDCQGADLTVTKTAAGSFNRDYDWSVVKSQTTSSTPINSTASSVSVAYKVKATWSGPTDSGWKVTGTITVHNPNDWEAVTLTNVTDAINNGGVCVVSGNTTQTIAASSDSTGLTYTCTYASAPSPAAGTNTATATWDKTAASTPDGSNTGTAGVDFSTVTPTVTHNTTTVKDTFNGGSPLTLGVANINGTFTKDAGNNLANWTQSYSSSTKTFTFTYTRTIPVVADVCKEYDNTATVSADATSGDNSSNASVVICGPVAGGLTMGFWQNNNGQAIIKAGASTGGVCNVGTWLRLFSPGPFQDLSATATCAQVATYVGNIIKNNGGINCGGSSCNPLLKAQMAATALDVYFSDPALGGNKIGAPAPIGGVKVNITNYSGAFGGATCLSVSAMLTYAASKSNSNGSVWYGQVKATQNLAQTAFNGINNAIVTTC